ncbi:hypothetical protein Taro_002491 [Colocasia esculenta]|uniref:Uncharacterized protein n=1 Tax=Colocasia esculenta TaxID=4460 RepID=A0A843TLM3_COLES|nr:hypothetical protein [Colocasia esculenta]
MDFKLRLEGHNLMERLESTTIRLQYGWINSWFSSSVDSTGCSCRQVLTGRGLGVRETVSCQWLSTGDTGAVDRHSYLELSKAGGHLNLQLSYEVSDGRLSNGVTSSNAITISRSIYRLRLGVFSFLVFSFIFICSFFIFTITLNCSLSLTIEVTGHNAIYHFVAHPLCSSEIIGATRLEGSHLFFWNREIKEQEEGGELTCVRHRPL